MSRRPSLPIGERIAREAERYLGVVESFAELEADPHHEARARAARARATELRTQRMRVARRRLLP
ncbi:MAG TPA: hypothetical protein VFM96_08980 [Gaiellaceae bacterium]|nr:hypothetical protein [Gaiellaceae bacterium]